MYLLYRKTVTDRLIYGNYLFYEALVVSQQRRSHSNKYRITLVYGLFLCVGLHTRYYIFYSMHVVFKTECIEGIDKKRNMQ